jgi:hypothetical protein
VIAKIEAQSRSGNWSSWLAKGVFVLNRRQEKQEARIKEAGFLLRVFRGRGGTPHLVTCCSTFSSQRSNPVYRPFLLGSPATHTLTRFTTSAMHPVGDIGEAGTLAMKAIT